MSLAGVSVLLLLAPFCIATQPLADTRTQIDFDEWDSETDQLVLEEPGSARLGLVQLNSGSTNFNTTLNLTGPILLGLGIAAATLFYAYFNAFKGAYRRYRRSPEDQMGTPWLSLAGCLSETEDDGLGRMASLLEVCS